MKSATEGPPKRGRGRPRKVHSDKPAFISGSDMARELCVSTATLYKWVAEEYFPLQRCRPGACTRLWLRSHWDIFVATGKWPADAWKQVYGGGR